jgi:hypothetical protein
VAVGRRVGVSSAESPRSWVRKDQRYGTGAKVECFILAA